MDPTVDALTAALESKDGMVRQAARERLVGLGRSVAPTLCPLLRHRRPQVRWEAALVLKDVADTSCVPALVESIFDTDEGVRWIAAEALGGLGKPGIRALLHLLIRDAASREVRTALRVASTRVVDPALRAVLEPLRETLVREATAGVVIIAADLARSRLDI